MHLVKDYLKQSYRFSSKRRLFKDSTGGSAFSEILYYNSIEIIQDFIKDIYGVDAFFTKPISRKLEEIDILSNSHRVVYGKYKSDPAILQRKPQTSVFELIDSIRSFSQEEFEECILPLIEVAFMWNLNKTLGMDTVKFRKHIAKRISRGDQGNFYGYLFEVYFSGLYLFSGQKMTPVDQPLTGERTIDWVLEGRNIGVECGDKRNTPDLTDDKIQNEIEERRSKFHSKATQSLALNKKFLCLNLTRKDYSRPAIGSLDRTKWQNPIVGYFTGSLQLSKELDGIILTWREKEGQDNGFDYKMKYALTGSNLKETVLPRMQALIHVRPQDYFFVRKYVWPEPTFGAFGPEETLLNA